MTQGDQILQIGIEKNHSENKMSENYKNEFMDIYKNAEMNTLQK